jgi:hypothetical protein
LIRGGFLDRHKAGVRGDRLISPTLFRACSCAAARGSSRAGVCLAACCMKAFACCAGLVYDPLLVVYRVLWLGVPTPLWPLQHLVSVFPQQQASALVCLVWVWAHALPTQQQQSSAPCVCRVCSIKTSYYPAPFVPQQQQSCEDVVHSLCCAWLSGDPCRVAFPGQQRPLMTHTHGETTGVVV